METKDDREVQEFWRLKAEELGTPVLWKSSGFFLGTTSEGKAEAAGVFYAGGESLVFEGMSSRNLIFGTFPLGRKEPETKAWRLDFARLDRAVFVSEGQAGACLEGRLDASALKDLGVPGFLFLGRSRVWALLGSDGGAFFSVIDTEGLLVLLRQRRPELLTRPRFPNRNKKPGKADR